MWIDIEDEQSKGMLVDIKDAEGNPNGKQSIVILVLDIYSKEVGEGQGRDQVTTIAYEIKTSPINSTMLKKPPMSNLFRKFPRLEIHPLRIR